MENKNIKERMQQNYLFWKQKLQDCEVRCQGRLVSKAVLQNLLKAIFTFEAAYRQMYDVVTPFTPEEADRMTHLTALILNTRNGNLADEHFIAFAQALGLEIGKRKMGDR